MKNRPLIIYECKDCDNVFTELLYTRNIIAGSNRHSGKDLIMYGKWLEVCPKCCSGDWRYVAKNDPKKANKS